MIRVKRILGSMGYDMVRFHLPDLANHPVHAFRGEFHIIIIIIPDLHVFNAKMLSRGLNLTLPDLLCLVRGLTFHVPKVIGFASNAIA
jgi:hypothetical protein